MAENDYDIVTVRGGPGGSSLAKSWPKKDARVLVLEREKEFKDRVRGEAMVPWGVAEAQHFENLRFALRNLRAQSPVVRFFLGSMQMMHRDLESTTPGRPRCSAFIIRLCRRF